MIVISPVAVNKIRELREGNQVLRVAVVGGGCSGLSYKLSFTERPEEDDNVLTFDPDLVVVMDKKSALFLNDLVLDYSDGLNGTGFVFNNPNAKRTCGCGSSFSN